MSEVLSHSVPSSTLADVLERVLDKGIVIAGDIKIKLVDIELLTIQLRLVVASVDKAREIGIDWWTRNPDLRASGNVGPTDKLTSPVEDVLAALDAKVSGIERRLSEAGAGAVQGASSATAVRGPRKTPTKRK